jgi:molybdenum ABC transporter molybdate-binding protein
MFAWRCNLSAICWNNDHFVVGVKEWKDGTPADYRICSLHDVASVEPISTAATGGALKIHLKSVRHFTANGTCHRRLTMPRNNRRPAFIQSAWVAFLGSVAVMGLLIGVLLWNSTSFRDNGSPGEQPATLTIYCAAGMRAPVEAIARDYEKEYGVKTQLQYSGSQILLASIEVSKRGDLYIPADDYYIRLAQEKKLLDEVVPLAEMTAVIAVRKGNPKKIQSLEQLAAGEVSFSLANPEAAAVGKLTRDALPAPLWERLSKHKKGFMLTVNEVANHIADGTVDAGIVWDATISQYADLEAVPCPELARKKAHVSVAVLKFCEQPTAALAFARYLAARDKGLVEFQRSGFKPVEGDVWAQKPELRLFAGAMLRPAIEDTIIAFEKREGIRVTRVYNGCGILVGQMKTGSRPDAYFACETSFMNQVKDLFLDPTDVSTNRLVIVVHKGNPHNIKTLDDLGKPGIRIGVGDEHNCALGLITQQTLSQEKVQSAAMKNVKVKLATGDGLVNALRTGSLDAVIAYISNAANLDDIEAYSVDKDCATAVQPWAVGKESQYKQLSGRLFEAIRTAESRERFESYGFGWKGAK